MDQTKFVQLLNEDLETEYRSIVQYVQHLAIATGAEFQAVSDAIRPHLKQELDHATTLAEQIDFLEGVPTTRVPPVPSESDTRTAFELDLELEQQQLARYRERYEQATQLGLPDVAEALRPLLEQTQDHVRDLQSALDK
jgi:bacterioferritin